jgi:CRP-like cAMP-binding protein
MSSTSRGLAPRGPTELPLLVGLTTAEIERLETELTPCEFGHGDQITRQGSRCADMLAFFVILSGEASVTLDGRPIRELGPGDHFGEIGLLEATARTATITAETDLRCLALSRPAFNSYIQATPRFAANLRPRGFRPRPRNPGAAWTTARPDSGSAT